jgi:hemoglobin
MNFFKNLLKQSVLSLAAVTLLSSLAHADAEGSKEYKDFGGKPGLTKVVDDLMTNLLADKRTEHFFAKADQQRIKDKLVEQFCVALEGPCTYTGRSMEDSHKGLNIKSADFNALVEDLQIAMTKNNIPERSQNKLLAKLAPLNKQIIKK